MILTVANAIYANYWVRSLEKIQDFNGIWTRDLVILVQYRYATDVGSWLIMCSYVPRARAKSEALDNIYSLVQQNL